ncbi:MAG TPA: cytidine deaminase [Chthoniobacterales bacterium]|jgi:cytidine deaminase
MDIEKLKSAAIAARKNAYVPYSGFAVGAAILTKSGRIFQGCNVESISFRLTQCAEQVALGAAVASGDTEFVAVVVVADTEHPVMPCGGCRQVLAEFAPDVQVISMSLKGQTETHSLSELLPRPKQGILEKPDGS